MGVQTCTTRVPSGRQYEYDHLGCAARVLLEHVRRGCLMLTEHQTLYWWPSTDVDG